MEKKKKQSGLITSFEHGDDEPKGRVVAIIRHGQTKLNAEDKIRAWLDVPLDEKGVSQAHELGVQMRDDAIELDGLVCSDLLRTRQTALIVSQETGIPVIGITRDLRPWDVGILSGTDGEKAHKIMMEHAWNAPDAPVGGDGESFNIFRVRMLLGIIAILNAHRGLRLGLVSHSRMERVLHAWVDNGCDLDLEVNLDTFEERGVGTATCELITINSPLVLP